MKSPWKFLARFTSRRRSVETRESSTEHDADTEADESQAPQTSVLPLNTTEASGGSEHDESRSVEPVATATSNETERDVEAARAVSASPRPKRPERAKRTRTDMVAQSPAIAHRDQNAQASSSRETFFEEVAVLDEDIKQLRIQLAQKLHLQNDQLKRMLARFEVS